MYGNILIILNILPQKEAFQASQKKEHFLLLRINVYELKILPLPATLLREKY